MKHVSRALFAPVRNTMEGLRRSLGSGRHGGTRSLVLAIGVLSASIAAANSVPPGGPARASASAQSTVRAPVVQPRGGSIQFFADQAAFAAALGIPSDLTSEKFDGGAAVGPFPTLCGEPMGSTSNDVCFTPGQIVPGFGITSTSGSGIINFTPLFLGPGQTSRAVGATNFADSTIVGFSPAIGAASGDIFGGLSVNPVDVDVFDTTGASMGTMTIAPHATRDSAAFFGVISAVPIGKIVFNAQNNAGELIDTLNFRAAGNFPPGIGMAFAPPSVTIGNASTLTITLGNQAQPGIATLSTDLIDTLPVGLVVAASPNASTTCAGGAVTASSGSGSITLGSGAQIPAAGTCTITVDVSAASPSAYANTMGAGALHTSLGNNIEAASAILLVSTGGPGTFPPSENFDENAPPLLPNGWVSSTTTGGNDWTASSTASDSAPNSAYATEKAFVSDFTMDTPIFTPLDRQNVTFRHRFNLERRFDGAVLEISINGGAFADIIAAGGSFVSGGYSYTILDGSSNPLTGRYAWTGNSQGFMTTTATLPSAAVGQPTQLRFRTADDASQVAPDGVPGWWVDSIVLGVDTPPVASIAPAALVFTVDPGATATQTLSIANEAGRDPLTFTVESRNSANRRPTLIPHTNLSKKTSEASKNLVPRLPSALASRVLASSHHAENPWTPQGSLMLQWDDGTAETALGVGAQSPSSEQGAVWMNRFSASDALVIHSVSVYWPDGDGDLSGLQANLVVYYDVDGDGDPTNAVRVGTDALVPISVTGTFQTYQTNFSIPAAGDVYIGFVDQWALAGGFTPRLFPAALDEDSSQGMSYISSASTPPADIVNLGNNDINGTILDVEQGSLNGNFMIRATATGGGGGGPCSGPIVNWLSASSTTNTVSGGANADVSVTVNPSAGNLVPGNHTAELCIATNDPTQGLISVPISVTVTGTPPPMPCTAGSDEVFCDGFDTQGNASIVSGTINQLVASNSDGSSFDFTTHSYHPYSGSITSDDINLYELSDGAPSGAGMYVYWYDDLVPAAFADQVGGVVDAGGVDFAVLHSGDSIGPGSTVSGGSTAMANWIGGADGYIGVAFYNEGTNALNYGYLHMTTTGPLGFPAHVLEWAYDKTGAAIAIP